MGIALRQLLCGLLATVTFITARVPGRAPIPAPSRDTTAAETAKSLADEVFSLVNTERAVRGLALLQRRQALDEAAQIRARDMAERDYFAHISPDGITPGDQILASGYEPLLCGENIASGYSTARNVMQAWMASPGHRENILEPRFRDIGLAFTEAPGTESGVLWVQEFGEPRADRSSRRPHPGRERRARRAISPDHRAARSPMHASLPASTLSPMPAY